MIKNSSKKFKDVKFKYSGAKEAFVELVKSKENINKTARPLRIKVKYNKKSKTDIPNLVVKLEKGSVFGPQPFLAIKTKSGKFIHDNFDFSIKKGVWHYAFHGDTLPIEDVLKLGIAANDRFGNTSIKRLDFKNPKKPKLY